jgi:hypothetical protein
MVILCYTNCCSHWGEAKMNRVLSWQCLGRDGDPPMTIFVRDETAQNQFDLDSTQDAIFCVPFDQSPQISGFVDPRNPGLVQGMFILRCHTRGDSGKGSIMSPFDDYLVWWFWCGYPVENPGISKRPRAPERGISQGLQPGHWRSCEKFLDVASGMLSRRQRVRSC